jgi:serine/threonine protein kinase
VIPPRERALAKLDHPGLLPVFELAEVGPVCYIASAYIDGPNLAQWLGSRNEPMDPRLGARFLVRIADAVNHAHERGVVHRDLKPSNILLEVEKTADGLPKPRVADFGLAKPIGPGRDTTTIGVLVGTPRYIAPEQLPGVRQFVGPQADMFALGVILGDLLRWPSGADEKGD